MPIVAVPFKACLANHPAFDGAQGIADTVGVEAFAIGCGSFGTVAQRQAMTSFRSAIAGHLW